METTPTLPVDDDVATSTFEDEVTEEEDPVAAALDAVGAGSGTAKNADDVGTTGEAGDEGGVISEVESTDDVKENFDDEDLQHPVFGALDDKGYENKDVHDVFGALEDQEYETKNSHDVFGALDDQEYESKTDVHDVFGALDDQEYETKNAHPVFGALDDEGYETKAEAAAAAAAAAATAALSFRSPPEAAQSVRKSLHQPSTLKKGGAMRLSEDVGPSGIDWKLLTVASFMILAVVAIIVGVTVGIKNNRADDNAAVAPTSAPSQVAVTMVPSPTPGVGGDDNVTEPLDCDLELKEFQLDDALVMLMTASSNITSVEIDYAASVFQKTYDALIKNGLESYNDTDYCDPYCRQLESVVATGYEILEGGNPTESNQTGCDAVVALNFTISGTFVGCNDTEFPGLFSPATMEMTEEGTAEARGIGVRRYLTARDLWEAAVAETIEEMMRTFQTVSFSSPSSAQRVSYLRATEKASQSSLKVDSAQSHILSRSLQGENSTSALCPVCPDDSTSLGNIAPSEDTLIEVMEPFVSVLPGICELVSIGLVE